MGILLSVSQTYSIMSYRSIYECIHSYFPDCMVGHRILWTICDFIDQMIPYDLILQYYYDNQDVFHNNQRDVSLFRAMFDRTGKSGAREWETGSDEIKQWGEDQAVRLWGSDFSQCIWL